MCSRQKRRISPFIRTEETGRRLRSLLASRGLTVKDVQKYLGLSCPQSIYRWLDGKSLIEDEYDIAVADEAYEEYLANPETHTHEEMKELLDL